MADDMFAGLKKKSKKGSSKKIDLLEVDEGETPSGESIVPPKGEDPVRPEEASADLTLPEEEPLDFSDLKKKKKKKNVALNLEDVETPTAAASSGATTTVDALGNTKIVEPTAGGDDQAENGDAPVIDAMAEFSGLKKKKKGKKTAFDLEAFEKELAAVEESGTSTPAGGADSPAPGGGSDDEGGEAADVPAPEGENPFDDEAGENAEGKSKAELAAEKKLWLQEPDRDYTYTELLGRFYSLLFASHPSLSRGGGKKRFTIAPPNISREGSKKSAFSNIGDICKKLHRQPEHVIQFLFAELGTSGSVDGSGRLVIKGRYQQKQIENVLRRYIVEYVTCKTCKSGDTLLTKDNRIFFVQCETCGSKTSVSSIKVGFQAQTKRRPKAA